MKFIAHGYTNPGGRSNNEDYYLYSDNVWILADGLGGHDCGEVASETAVVAANEVFSSSGGALDETLLCDILRNANNAVIEKQNENSSLSSMRTTIVFAVSDGAIVRYANVGDSRFYYFRNGRIIAQSEDHSVSAMSAKLGDISYDEIRNDPDRNKLIKALGNDERLNVKIPEREFVAQSGDAFLLCSDGFWEYVYETEMEIDLAKSSDPKEWLNYMTKRVLLKTKGCDNDNFTVIGVMVE